MDFDKIYEKKVRNTALLVVAMGSFLIPFMGSSLNIALPIIQNDTGSKYNITRMDTHSICIG